MSYYHNKTSHFQVFNFCTGATTYNRRPSKVSDGYTKIISKKQAKQTALVSDGDRNQSYWTSTYCCIRCSKSILLQHLILRPDGLKICSAGAANTDAPSHTRTAYAIVTEHNKNFQQVRIYNKSTEVDTLADIHFSWLRRRRQSDGWTLGNTKAGVKQSCGWFVRTGNAKEGKMGAFACLGEDAHIYHSNWRREPKCHLTLQKPPSY